MSLLQIIKNMCRAIVDGMRGRKEGRPKLIMTLLVRNEELILEQNILFHKAMGIDAFIITDNNSTDSTPAIIQKYMDKGWVVESIKDSAEGHNQKLKVDKMIRSARDNHAADWVINCDADELWHTPSGDLKSEMMGRENLLRCRVVGAYPEADKPFWEFDKYVKPISDTAKYDLSLYSIYCGYTYKVAHATRGYVKISNGNHKVAMLPKRQRESDITVYHYNNISREQFVAKMKNGGKQMEQNPKKSVARHWRYFYELYKEGRIEEEYDRVVGTKWQAEFLEKGYIYQDSCVADLFAKIDMPK